MEIFSLIGKFSRPFIERLAKFFLEAKKNEAHREIKIKVGPNKEIALKGFGGDDLNSMQGSLMELAQALKSG